MNARNALIASLPRGARVDFMKRCEHVQLVFGEVLCEADRRISHAYFPIQGFISRTCILDDHQPLEVGLIGSEGMLGSTIVLGVDQAPIRAVVQGDGTALRISTADLRGELRRPSQMSDIMRRYLYLLVSQLARSSACVRFHELAPRLARWLLMTHDRSHSDHFYLTHEFLANMLGVRRSGVSMAAADLKRRKLIRYSRGQIHVLDRKGLEAASCTCYAIQARQESAFRTAR